MPPIENAPEPAVIVPAPIPVVFRSRTPETLVKVVVEVPAEIHRLGRMVEPAVIDLAVPEESVSFSVPVPVMVRFVLVDVSQTVEVVGKLSVAVPVAMTRTLLFDDAKKPIVCV